MLAHSRARALARAGLLAALLTVMPAEAGQIRISPLSLGLTPAQRAASLTLLNEADTPVSLQVRVFSWQQDVDAGMLLSPTSDVALSPAMVTLAPGATQLVRVLARGTGEAGERYYRVLVDELPSGAGASRDQVQVLTRYSLPLFLEPRVAGLPRLTLQAQHCQDGRQRLLVGNSGERRARLADWRLLAGDEVLTLQPGLAGYALAGGTLTLPLPSGMAWPATPVRLVAGTDLGGWQGEVAPPGEPVACPSPVKPD